MTHPNSKTHASILARMVEKAPGQKLGRTQVMKLCYFLQELKLIPLGYDFRLFTYGPFDSEVLGDLGSSCGLKAVVEKTVLYPRGFGSAITPGANGRRLSQQLEESDPTMTNAIDSVVAEFGSYSASELELRSTILFVDRDSSLTGIPADAFALAEKVNKIKPHFAVTTIVDRIREMLNKGWLQSLSPSAR